MLITALFCSNCYAQTQETGDAIGRREEILTSTLSHYEREVTVRKRVKEEWLIPKKEGLNVIRHFNTDVTEAYDDNIYNEHNYKRGDFITNITPTFRLDFLTEKLFIDTNYTLTMNRYQKLDTEWFNYSVGARGVYHFSPRILIKLADAYQRIGSLTELEGSDYTPSGHTLEKVDYNSFYMKGEYNFLRAGNKLWLDYANNAAGVRNHGRNNTFSVRDQRVGFGLTHNFTRRTSLSPAYIFYNHSDKKGPISDYNANGLQLGFTHILANVIEGKGEFGWEYREYAHVAQTQGAPFVNLGLTSIFSRVTTLEMDYTFNKEPSYSGGIGYDCTKLGAGIYHYFTPLMRSFISTVYEMRDYTGVLEEDIFRLGLGFDFNLGDRLKATLSHNITRKDSTSVGSEYVDRTYLISVRSVLW